MIRKIAFLLVLTLIIIVSVVGAQEYPVPEDFDWICNGSPLGIGCIKIGDPQSNVHMGFPEGYCISITLPAYVQDGIMYYYYYMVPCEPVIVPEVSQSTLDWFKEAEIGDELHDAPLPGNVVEKQSENSFTVYEDKGDGLIGWQHFIIRENGIVEKLDYDITDVSK